MRRKIRRRLRSLECNGILRRVRNGFRNRTAGAIPFRGSPQARRSRDVFPARKGGGGNIVEIVQFPAVYTGDMIINRQLGSSFKKRPERKEKRFDCLSRRIRKRETSVHKQKGRDGKRSSPSPLLQKGGIGRDLRRLPHQFRCNRPKQVGHPVSGEINLREQGALQVAFDVQRLPVRSAKREHAQDDAREQYGEGKEQRQRKRGSQPFEHVSHLLHCAVLLSFT
ncbi:MAG: hypothetical protein BWY86_01485 [Candidatus Aminicenantes bacterium ADurb.Bin508]|nr:MAG: hypothetical protein BWY86_01485 [Candidatus Aminicenantes bacterium ADurb.Bin508]